MSLKHRNLLSCLVDFSVFIYAIKNGEYASGAWKDQLKMPIQKWLIAFILQLNMSTSKLSCQSNNLCQNQILHKLSHRMIVEFNYSVLMYYKFNEEIEVCSAFPHNKLIVIYYGVYIL